METSKWDTNGVRYTLVIAPLSLVLSGCGGIEDTLERNSLCFQNEDINVVSTNVGLEYDHIVLKLNALPFYVSNDDGEKSRSMIVSMYSNEKAMTKPANLDSIAQKLSEKAIRATKILDSDGLYRVKVPSKSALASYYLFKIESFNTIDNVDTLMLRNSFVGTCIDSAGGRVQTCFFGRQVENFSYRYSYSESDLTYFDQIDEHLKKTISNASCAKN